jgi:hypothetical protein
MAKKSGGTTLLVIALTLPILGVSFIMNIVNMVLQYAFASTEDFAMAQTVFEMTNLYLPLVLLLVGLAFSIVVLLKSKDKILPITALVLNSILVVTGLINLVFTYFVEAPLY